VDNSFADLQDWNRNATAYIGDLPPSEGAVYRQFKDQLWACLGNLHELDVLDLGCGHGWLSREMAQAGGRVWGVDGSSELLRRARLAYPELDFTEWDLNQGLPPTERRFDRVIANMVLMDIAELAPLMAGVSRVLKTAGRLIFTITHPCFFRQKLMQEPETGQWYRKVTGYHQPEVWRIDSFGGHTHYHRNLTFYFDLLRNNRLAVTRFFEPVHIPNLEGPAGDLLRSIPVFLLIEARPCGAIDETD
jgi:SAM-dependent methyltransferase